MAKSLDQKFPYLTRWIREHGWTEIGQDHYSRSFIRVVDEGGIMWEGATNYETIDEALKAAEAATAKWIREEWGER